MSDVKQCVLDVASKFEYRADPEFIVDYWYVMRERNGKLKGDCEDFSLTVFWFLAGKNLFVFLWNLLITHKYKVYLVDAVNGSHIIGCYDNLYFDNWTLKALPKEEFFKVTKHKMNFRANVLTMFMPLIFGFIYRIFK
jgi:hypothetical protein